MSDTLPRFERPLRVRFAHCDPAGIVFFSQYLTMFNGLVEDWFTEGLGIPYVGLIGTRRVGLPTVKIELEFRAISRMGDDVTLGLAVEHLGRSSLTLTLDCRAGGEQRVNARQVIVFTDLHTHRAAPVPPDVRQALGNFMHTN
jgi:4-hydroxybenzoyl-CoA thioesterase